jgi:alkanesulfonate monooxygenase SsuD/methylene tetrahydromethanopterin reductase-like flavin-dependent oxidoreductase (luciferase family)
MTAARAKWFVGTAEAVASDLRDFATQHGVDEVMISPIAGSYENEPMDSSPGRLQTLELLAAFMAS